MASRFDPAFFRAQGWWRDETLREWLTRRVADFGDRPAIVTPERTLTYRQFAEEVRPFASGLAALGIGHGDVVAVHLPNLAEFLIAWLAINECGAAMQTIHMPYGTREVELMLRHSGAKACIAMAQLKERSPAAEIAMLRGALPKLAHVIAVGGAAAGCEEFTAVMARGEGSPATADATQATDPFMLLYTSGTTAAPKAVSVSYNHFLSNARMCAAELGITAKDRILCIAPYTHLYGLYTLQLGFSAGAAACLLDMFTPPGLVQTLKRFKPSYLFGGPAHISACLPQGLLNGVDLSELRVAVLSGTTVPAPLSEAFEAMMPNGKVLQAWGMTELQFGACSRPTDTRDVRFETIGHATPGTELRIADADGNVLASGEVGELHVRGCSLFSGYVGNEDANRAAFTTDGWFRTGDLASMDAEGNVRLSGRTKELINRGGIKFNPADMETALLAHPAIALIAIAPLPDPILGERAACFVVLKPNAALSFDALKEFLTEHRFAKFTWPESLIVVADMPMTPTRKVMKTELVRRYLTAAGAAA